MTENRITGGCQCGAVRYVLTEPPDHVYACHCSVCQRVSASAFNISCIVIESAMTVTKGELSRIDWVVESGSRRFGEFCPQCGVRVRHGSYPSVGDHDRDHCNWWSVRGGTLDDQRYAHPVAHIWLSESMSWFKPPDGDLCFQTQPQDYSEISALYKQRFGRLD